MGMLMLNKKRLITIFFIVFIIWESEALTFVEEINKKNKEAKKECKLIELSLEDYYPHIDGMAYIFLNSENKYKSFIEFNFFTSLYKKNYYISYNVDTVTGYIEKITYKEPYDVKNSISSIEDEFSYTLSEMTSDNKIDKFVLFSLELLQEY